MFDVRLGGIMISGLIMGLFAAIASCIRYKRLLKKCLLSDRDRENVFVFKGKFYDADKYSELRREDLAECKNGILQSLLDDLISDCKKHEPNERDKLEMSILKNELAKRSAKASI